MGQQGKSILSEKDGIVTISCCLPGKFEHLLKLIETLQTKQVLQDLDINKAEHYRAVITRKDKTYYLFDHAYKKTDKKDVVQYAIDIRLPGLYTHGLTGHHNDGYMQGIYVYLRLIKKLTPLEALQKLMNLLTLGGKPTSLTLARGT